MFEIFEGINHVKNFFELSSQMNIKKVNISILSCISKIKDVLMCTDLQEWLLCKTKEIESIEDGLYDININKSFNTLKIKNDNSNENYPDNPVIKDDMNFIQLTINQRQSMIEAYTFVSDDITRLWMNGICIDRKYIVSTDSRRLYCDSIFKEEMKKVILRKSKLMLKILKYGEDIQFGYDNKNVVIKFRYKGSYFKYINTILDIQFVDWQRVLPKDYKYEIGIPDIKQWSKCYKEIKGCVDKSKKIVLQFNHNDTVNMIVDEKASKTGKEIQISSINWKHNILDLENLAINYEYLNDVLQLNPDFIQITDFIHTLDFRFKDYLNKKLMQMPMKDE
jgi:hypothetical protein